MIKNNSSAEIRSDISKDCISVYIDKDNRIFDNKVTAFSIVGSDSNDRQQAGILTPKISKIFYDESKKIIVVKWENGKQTKVTCHPEDTFNLEVGISRAITKYVLGNNYNSQTILEKYVKSAVAATKRK